jgi:ATP-dependent Clp protease ATP-binding subunit ClpC
MLEGHFNKFTKEAKEALIVAQDYAKGAGYVGTEHLLIGILSQENSLGASVLINFGVSIQTVEMILKTGGKNKSPDAAFGGAGTTGLSSFAKKIIEDSVKIAHE